MYVEETEEEEEEEMANAFEAQRMMALTPAAPRTRNTRSRPNASAEAQQVGR